MSAIFAHHFGVRMPVRKVCMIMLVCLASQNTMSGFQEKAIAIRCGALIDGISSAPRMNVTLVVRGNTIVSVGNDVPPEAEVIDLSDATVLSGLIDCHTHVLLQGDITSEDYAAQILKESIPYRTLRATVACTTALMNGFTTIRDLETEGAMYADVDLKKAIANGVIMGPRMFVATRAINTTGHYLLGNREYAWELRLPKGLQEITGEDEARRAVREQISYGADWIKVYADRSYHRLPGGTYRSSPNFSEEELTAIGEEVRMHRKKFSAHAVTRDGILPAIRAGAQSIEHGFGMDDECIRLMVEKGVYWCPTIHVNAWVAEGRAAAGNPMNKMFQESLPETFRKAVKAGVKVAFGTDAGGFAWTENQAKEFTYMVEWGMTPMEAIRSATVVAAELLDMKGKLGQISPGAFADIIAVKGDPLKDVTVLQQVGFVMKDGRVVKGLGD